MQFKIGDLVKGIDPRDKGRSGPFVVVGFDRRDFVWLYSIKRQKKILDYPSLFARVERR